MDKSLETITIPSSSSPVGVIVALHGWGSNAEDLVSVAPFLNLSNYLMLFPQAPFNHANGGRMWYDFQNSNSSELQSSLDLLKTYLSSVVEMGIPIFLLGFSQGAAMTLDIGLEFNFAGLIALSGYLHPTINQKNSVNQKNSDQQPISPILIIHGVNDSVVPVIAAQSAKTTLARLGAKVTYAEFPMGHEINPEAIAMVRKFILDNSENP